MTSTAQGDMNDKLRNEGLPVPKEGEPGLTPHICLALSPETNCEICGEPIRPKEAETAEPMSVEVSRFVETWTAPMVDRLAARKELNVLVRQAEQAAYERGRESGAKKFAEEMAEEFERQGFPLIAGRISAVATSSEPGEDT